MNVDAPLLETVLLADAESIRRARVGQRGSDRGVNSDADRAPTPHRCDSKNAGAGANGARASRRRNRTACCIGGSGQRIGYKMAPRMPVSVLFSSMGALRTIDVS